VNARSRVREWGWRRIVGWGALGALGLVLLAQLVPYGRDHTNPAVRAEPRWDSPRTRALASKSCFDCHSNLTKWTWYSNIAPASWLIYNDVKGGRETLNFSEWDRSQRSAAEIVEQIDSGEMPPLQYTLVHPGARLSGAEKRDLIAGMRATLGG